MNHFNAGPSNGPQISGTHYIRVILVEIKAKVLGLGLVARGNTRTHARTHAHVQYTCRHTFAVFSQTRDNYFENKMYICDKLLQNVPEFAG